MMYVKVSDAKYKLVLYMLIWMKSYWNSIMCWKLCFSHVILVHVSDKIDVTSTAIFWRKYHYKWPYWACTNDKIKKMHYIP